MRSFIIHMSSASERVDNVAHLMAILPEPLVIEAVDGRDPLQTRGISKVQGTLHHPPYPFLLNDGEVGCFLSHRACWERIAKGDEPYAMIAEDDLTIDPVPFAAALDLIHRYATEDSFIRLPAKDRERAVGAIARQGSATLFLPKTVGLQSVCQVVGRAAARRLLDMTCTIDRPVDTTLQMHWVTGQKVHTILPNGIADLPVPSTIQRKTRASGVLMREMRRATYRAKIRRIPQVA